VLRITIEMVPHGDESRKRVIYVAKIINLLTGTKTRGDYGMIMYRGRSTKAIWKKCRINGFPRKQRNAWDLLYRGLREIIGGRNNDSSRRRDNRS
jgi:hypothetical protein